MVSYVLKTGDPMPRNWIDDVFLVPDVVSKIVSYVGLRDIDSMTMVCRELQRIIIHHPSCRHRRTRFLRLWEKMVSYRPCSTPVDRRTCRNKLARILSRQPCLVFCPCPGCQTRSGGEGDGEFRMPAPAVHGHIEGFCAHALVETSEFTE